MCWSVINRTDLIVRCRMLLICRQINQLWMERFGWILMESLTWCIVMSQMASGQVSPAMRIPMWVIYGAIPMGMAFCVIRYIVEIYHSVKNFNKPEDREVLE